MMKKGLVAKNMHYNYIPTYTGQGHASIYTGSTPSEHGIIANSWYDKYSGKYAYCVEDSLAQTVGSSSDYGQYSPKKLITGTITDQLRITSNWRSKVISMSIKNRGAILPAGFSANAAYWFDFSNGDFISSSHYLKELPQWVVNFNAKKYPDACLEKSWTTLLPINQYTESDQDGNNYESNLLGGDHNTFPYDLKVQAANAKDEKYDLFANTPFGNTYLKDLAKTAIDSEQLGKDDQTDFLAISFSSTDLIGHDFGPRAIETEDTYLRLDKDIEDLLNHLDEKVGKGEYLVFLTSDHGVVDILKYLENHNFPAEYTEPWSQIKSLRTALNKHFGKGEWIQKHTSTELFFNRDTIYNRGHDLAEMQRFCANFMIDHHGIYKTYAASDIVTMSPTTAMEVANKKRL